MWIWRKSKKGKPVVIDTPNYWKLPTNKRHHFNAAPVDSVPTHEIIEIDGDDEDDNDGCGLLLLGAEVMADFCRTSSSDTFVGCDALDHETPPDFDFGGGSGGGSGAGGDF